MTGWRVPEPWGWGLAAVVLAGVAFAWWARIHLGQPWSGYITRKPDRRLIDTGPYAIVRHPTNTGLLVSLYATAITHGSASALVGIAMLTYALGTKSRMEDKWLKGELGAAYGDYDRRVPRLIPFWPAS